MSNSSRLRRISSAAIAGAAAVAVLAPAASAMGTTTVVPAADSSASVSMNKVTPDKYMAYLIKQRTPESRAVLKAFRALPKAKQVKFLGYLQSRTVYMAFGGQLRGHADENKPVRAVTNHNKDVKFVRATQTNKTKQGRKATVMVAFTVTEKVFNIPVTSEQVWVKYESKRGEVRKVLGGGAKLTNLNAAINITGGKVKPTNLEGHNGFVATTWKATQRADGFGGDIVKQQRVQAGWGNTFKANLNNV
ncbi:hypothetical protein RB199_30395 [Streptomyces libani]|uniref:Lipoprotein n=2 Tax=Streptomyces nigrescens TaxID=1920 RepID=A0A640TPP1_STRNI|nr:MULTISPECIES: hypothetical protein [Streptomyces]WAT99872.1 hypothetical protein STRLI_006069 [Streptomyces libani subsp. libani]WAU07844.1 hypothetical protein STRNI_006487 [Streptomyces nigrescens]GFE25933.1 hypothetical protein Sliba_63860 [Streptomyces libani subsp. libani]GGW03661.1 hypothetical protein GCM10010500_63950 [Streptomyces libani subsp. libani]